MMGKQKLAVICGPTASGKTALAVDVARALNGEVVSADSMQLYRGMDIGTAKPSADETMGVPHHMIDCAEIGEDWGAAVYRDRARACISGIAGRGRLPVLCGGTGLYISATVYPLDFSNAGADEARRAELAGYAREHGGEALHRRLAEISPGAAAAIHPNNVRRVIRALEKLKSADGPETGREGQQLFNGEPLYDAAWVGLTMDRDALYRRIDARVDGMMRRGLLEEASRLAARHGRESIAFQGLGYKELLEYLDGRITLEEAVERIKRGTRRYAKRQLTWFGREKGIRWFRLEDFKSREELSLAVAGYIRDTLHIS